MLQAFSDAIAVQVDWFRTSPTNSIAMTVVLDFLIGYTILTILSGRTAHEIERWLVPLLLAIIVWVSLELMEKSQWAGFVSY